MSLFLFNSRTSQRMVGHMAWNAYLAVPSNDPWRRSCARTDPLSSPWGMRSQVEKPSLKGWASLWTLSVLQLSLLSFCFIWAFCPSSLSPSGPLYSLIGLRWFLFHSLLIIKQLLKCFQTKGFAYMFLCASEVWGLNCMLFNKWISL